jgi:hypothetical protein
MAEKTQSFQNHTRFDPAFHFFVAPLSLVFLIAAIVHLVRDPGWVTGFQVLAVIWVTVAVFRIRIYALKNQDRIIRLEGRLRLQKLLAEPLKGRIGELTESQLIGLRFASDAELPGLMEKTLAGKWAAKEIKQAIQTWRPDYWRV